MKETSFKNLWDLKGLRMISQYTKTFGLWYLRMAAEEGQFPEVA